MAPERPPQAQLSRPTRGSEDPRDRLRHLAAPAGDIAGPATGAPREVQRHGLDERTAALVRLAALVALRAAPASYQGDVDRAVDAGASADDVVDTLKTVARTVGLARVVSAAPDLALALGYDIDRALETLDDPRIGDTYGLVRVVGVESRRRDATEGPANGGGDPTA